MIFKKDLKYILTLINDDDEVIQEELISQLDNYHGILEQDILSIMGYIPSNLRDTLNPVFENNRRKWLLSEWIEVQDDMDEYEKLELKLDLLSKYQIGFLEKRKSFNYYLDYFAEEFKILYPEGNELNLAYFLFQYHGLKGNTDDYFHPQNSNVIETIENKKGLPITLAIIYMLVGKRLGMSIEGCNFPSHFLACTTINGEKLYIDCFNQGIILSREELADLLGDFHFGIDIFLEQTTTTNMIIARVIRNLINAYKLKNDFERVEFYNSLLSITPQK